MTTPSPEPVYFLLVDDLEENLLSLDALLRREGLVMLKARSGKEALELLLSHEPALALLDVQMPGMDGFELAELMRGTERTRRVPIIFLTAGNADLQRRFRGYEAGAVDFLNKPIEPDILRSKAKIFFDLFRQKQQLATQRDELQVAAEENARLLEETRQFAAALKEADHHKDEFLATLAHELRNPLSPIRNGLQIIKLSSDPAVLENVRNIMERQLSHLVRLIDDLLDVSRVSQGKIELRRAPITIQTAVQSALEASQPLIDKSRHHISVNVPADDIWVNGDLTRLSQMMTNLLNNAAKYTEEGGNITLSAWREKETVVVTVADNGIGIPAAMLPKVFDLFTQIDYNLDRSQGGLGIGLALVKRLTEMHGGSVDAESAGLGHGSIFTLRLPIIEPPLERQAAVAKQAPAEQAGTGLNILVVDDNVAAAQTTGWMVELIGHQPQLAHTGPQALNLARELHPEAILLDIGLPGMTGYEVCRELRLDPAFKDTIIIAQTGWGQDRDRQLAQEAGFDHHLVKPVSLDDITKLLANLKKS